MLIKYCIYDILWTASLNIVNSSLREGSHWDQNVELNIKYSVVHNLYVLLYCQLRLGYAVKKKKVIKHVKETTVINVYSLWHKHNFPTAFSGVYSTSFHFSN